MARQGGHRVRRAFRSMGDIETHAERRRDPAVPRLRHGLGQDAGEFGAAELDVVRPFDLDRARPPGQHRSRGVANGKGRDEANLAGDERRAMKREDKGRVEISGLRHPVAAETAAALRLEVGDDPQGTVFAFLGEAVRFRIGRVDGLEVKETAQQSHQNKDAAAACARLLKGCGKSAKSSTKRPANTITALTSATIGSKRSAGSSKYMSLTMRM